MFTKRGQRSLAADILWLPWSLCAWGLSFACMGLVAAAAVPVLIFRPFEKFQTWLHPAMSIPVRLTFSRLVVEFDPAFDRGTCCMFAQNHVSMMDANIACGAIPVPFCGMENASHLSLPGYGTILRLANAIPVRKGAGRYRELEAAVADRASRGISVLTFPEAHRTLDGNVRPFKRGVFRMARNTGLPIVPVCVRGAFRMLPKGAITSRPSCVEVYVGPQIPVEGLDDEQLVILAERVRRGIQAWIDRREKYGQRWLAAIEDPETRAPNRDRIAL